MKKVNARIEKWRVFLTKSFNSQLGKKGIKSKGFLKKIEIIFLVKKKVRKGIPDCLRGKVWLKLANTEGYLKDCPYNFQDIIKDPSESYNEIILDVQRTFPNHVFFSTTTVGKDSLKNVLNAVSKVYKDMGYCQGLNFLAGLFLLYMNDEVKFVFYIKKSPFSKLFC